MFSNKKITVTFTDKTIVRVVVIVVLSILSLSLIRYAAHSLVLIGSAVFLAVALNPAVSFIARHLRSKSRIRATGMAYLIVLAVLAGFLWLVLPPLVRQTSDFVQRLPENVNHFTREDSVVMRFVHRHGLEAELETTTQNIRSHFDDLSSSAVSTAGRIWGFLLSLVAVLVMTFMMLVEGPYWLDRFWRMQDPKKTPRRKKVLSRMYGVVTGYVNGQLLIALIAGFFTLTMLLISSTLLEVSVNAVVYALLITLTGLIPMFGASIGALVVVTLCAFASVPLAIIMAVFFLIYQQIENATIQPMIQAKQNELTPLSVFIAALIGIGFGGILGAFVAIPVVGCIRIYLVEYYGDKLDPSLAAVKAKIDKK